MARGSNLITSAYGGIIAGSNNTYFEKLKALVKSSENDKLGAAPAWESQKSSMQLSSK
jgi:hypothetical protein